jgi:putative MATE family efflux protein
MTDAAAPQPTAQARFVTGSTLNHVVVMTLTGALGLMSLFLVDLLDLFYLSLLNKTEVTAAIGYAGILSFANLSISIGTGIAAAALVARNLGARRAERAREYASSTLLFTFLVTGLFSSVMAFFADELLGVLGAQGEALRLAKLFLWTLVPGFVMLGGAVCCSFTLRGLGDARRAMYITLVAALVTVVVDPIFIFGFGLGIQGAAVANVIADAAALAVGIHGVARVHDFLPPMRLPALRRDLKDILAIAVPAMLTQLATPFANAYVTRAVAPFGDEAVAASAIIGRLIPVAFGVIFSLSGAVGPIIGQNFGARRFDRVRGTLRDGMIVSAIYTALTSLLLFVFRHQVPGLFKAQGLTIELVTFFCTFIAISWAFAGAQFVANAAFNNLGRPNLSTYVNWAKATLGTIPPAYFGGLWYGPKGVLLGVALGSVVFGVASVVWAYRIADTLEKG